MIYLINNLFTTYTLIAPSISDIPVTDTYNINNGTFNINDTVFANIIYMPNTLSLNSSDVQRNLSVTVDSNYEFNRYKILVQNRNKFVIAVVKYLPNRVKDIVYINFYTTLLDSSMQYNDEYKRLLENSPHHHYEILNYHTGKFEEHIKKEDAIQKLHQYMNEFMVEYRPNIVKEFITKEEFLEYIKL